MASGFNFKAREFDGPLDVLLSMVEQHKMHVGDISLRDVADSFIDYVRGASEIPTAEMADFILTAATLALIKSRALLPKIKMTKEETACIRELENRVEEYSIIRSEGTRLALIFGKNIMHERGFHQRTKSFLPPSEFPNKLREKIKLLAQELISSLPSAEALMERHVKKTISLEDTIKKIVVELKKNLNLGFSNISGSERSEVIVSFLALLEIMKQGKVFLRQHEPFGEIHIETDSVSVPQY